jgi:hypothetical protein
MSQLDTLAKSMSAGTPAREVIRDPITLQSTVNGSLVTVQRNSIAHAELAQGENGMLVKAYNPTGRSKAFTSGVGFNTDGTIKGREHLIQKPARSPGNDVQNISPAMAAVRNRGEDSTEDQSSENEVALQEANDATSRAQLEAADAKQAQATAEAELAEMKAKMREMNKSSATVATAVKKR